MEVPEISGALNDTFKDKNVAVESMWELATAFRGDWENREGWGWHNLEDWDLFLTTIRDIGQLTRTLRPRTSSSTTTSPPLTSSTTSRS